MVNLIIRIRTLSQKQTIQEPGTRNKIQARPNSDSQFLYQNQFQTWQIFNVL
jgi:hypothetical protein